MAKQTPNWGNGTRPDGSDGDTFLEGTQKLMGNIDEIYTQLGAGANGQLPPAIPVTSGGTGVTSIPQLNVATRNFRKQLPAQSASGRFLLLAAVPDAGNSYNELAIHLNGLNDFGQRHMGSLELRISTRSMGATAGQDPTSFLRVIRTSQGALGVTVWAYTLNSFLYIYLKSASYTPPIELDVRYRTGAMTNASGAIDMTTVDAWETSIDASAVQVPPKGLPLEAGGTGGQSAAEARANLGLGAFAVNDYLPVMTNLGAGVGTNYNIIQMGNWQKSVGQGNFGALHMIAGSGGSAAREVALTTYSDAGANKVTIAAGNTDATVRYGTDATNYPILTTRDIGTSGAGKVPTLDGVNTWSNRQTIAAGYPARLWEITGITAGTVGRFCGLEGGGSGTSSSFYWYKRTDPNTTTNQVLVYFPTTSGTFALTTSDETIKDKQRIVPDDECLARLSKLELWEYNFKFEASQSVDVTAEPRRGFMAQQANIVDRCYAIKPKAEGELWGIDDRALIADLVGTVRHLAKRIKELEDKLEVIQ